MKIVIDAGAIFRDYESVEMDRYFTDYLVRMIRTNPNQNFGFSTPHFSGIKLGRDSCLPDFL
jgi:hypothetical protein